MRYQGKYIPHFPHKYKGDPRNIVYRSSWEYKFMKWCDFAPSVREWGSEEIVIPYVSPADGKIHRYFPDFYVNIDGKTKYIVEVKPFYQTQEPKTQSRNTKKYITEVVTYHVNKAKWDAAINFCESHSMKFMLITEKELKI
jgi:hypothetical protein